MSSYPYADRYPVLRVLPEEGRDRESILNELREMATAEDSFWHTGKASGSFYCGDTDHYAFMSEAFGMYGHMNALQRDVCPSATRFEGEIIAMGLDLFNAASAGADSDPAGMITSGGSGSILHAMLAYRDQARAVRGITNPNFVKPETGHPAFDKACHLLGIEVRMARSDPVTAQVDVAALEALIDDQTIAIMGSASNYGYGTIDPIAELGQVALAHGVGLHVDGCLGGFILPFGEQLGYPIPAFDFRVPGVTTLSAYAAPHIIGGTTLSIASLIDARHGNAYCQFVSASGHPLIEPARMGLEDIARALGNGGVKVIGPGADLLLPFVDILGPQVFIEPSPPAPDIVWIARLGLAADPAHSPPEPLYLRGADAKPQDHARIARH